MRAERLRGPLAHAASQQRMRRSDVQSVHAIAEPEQLGGIVAVQIGGRAIELRPRVHEANYAQAFLAREYPKRRHRGFRQHGGHGIPHTDAESTRHADADHHVEPASRQRLRDGGEFEQARNGAIFVGLQAHKVDPDDALWRREQGAAFHDGRDPGDAIDARDDIHGMAEVGQRRVARHRDVRNDRQQPVVHFAFETGHDRLHEDQNGDGQGQPSERQYADKRNEAAPRAGIAQADVDGQRVEQGHEPSARDQRASLRHSTNPPRSWRQADGEPA